MNHHQPNFQSHLPSYLNTVSQNQKDNEGTIYNTNFNDYSERNLINGSKSIIFEDMTPKDNEINGSMIIRDEFQDDEIKRKLCFS